MGAELDRPKAICEKVNNPGAELIGKAKMEQFSYQYDGMIVLNAEL